MFDNIDFLSGNIHYISETLDEDMLMVEYPNEHILDVGWYGDKNGFFIYLIRDHNWSIPLAKNREELFILPPNAIKKIDQEAPKNQRYYGDLWETEIFTL